MTECYDVACVLSGGICTLVSITAVSMTLVSLSLLHRYGELLKERHLYAYYGLIGVVLLVGGAAVIISAFPATECTTHSGVGVDIEQDPGMVRIETFNLASDSNLDSVGIVDSNGTRSTMMTSFEDGSTFTLRSNESITSYLNDPENNITVLTTAGTKTVERVGELPFEYRKAPAGFVDPDEDIGNYANASVATVACLYNSTASFELGGRRVPANVSIPCNTPVLAQNDSVTVGTSVKPTSGPNADKVLTSPITLRSGEYHLIGTVDGNENVVQSFRVTDKVA